MKTIQISSFQEFLTYTEPLKNHAYFRGQADSQWAIIPSLFRKDPIPTLAMEQKKIKEEMEASKLDSISALFKLQHYGTPTRICDLTISPLSALFFATSGKDTANSDGVVCVFRKECQRQITDRELQLFSKYLREMLKIMIPKDYSLSFQIII